MPHILVTNDDGYQAPALPAMVRALKRVGRVTVFAPDHNWSAAGHTKTMHKPLRINEGTMPDGTPLFVTTGTPSDCVGLALLGIVSEPPDLVISGINNGSNLGQDVTYSGTVAAAMEGAVSGLPAIAASQDFTADRSGDLDFAADVLAVLAEQVLIHGLPPSCLLNVNFPACAAAEVRGIRLTRLGRRIYRDVLIARIDPRGRPYYWIGGEAPAGEADPGTDIAALREGYVSITPLNLDMTDERELLDMSTWDLRPPFEITIAPEAAAPGAAP
jgi:5'-nucleotidase